jgi:hypothetical protein
LNKHLELKKINIRFGNWNVRSLYKAGSLTTPEKEIPKCELDLAGVKIRWDRGGTKPADEYIFSYGKGNENQESGKEFFFF